MAQNHLQLHGQVGSNVEEADSSRSSGGSSRIGSGSWLELKKIIAQENDQGKDLSSQLIQQSELHTNFIAGQS